jgi:hypothetical protein
MACKTIWSLVLVAGALGAVPAQAGLFGDDDTLQSLLADCGGKDLPADSIDSCLERAHALEETEPSTTLQSLAARLERRADAVSDGTTFPEIGDDHEVRAEPGSSGTHDVAPQERDGDVLPTPVEKEISGDTGSASPDVTTAERPEETKSDDDPPPVEDDDGDETPPPESPHGFVH